MATPAVPPGIQPSPPQIHRSLSEPPPSHQPDPHDPMNFEYPDLHGSVHAVFDTQLPGGAVDSPTQASQEEPDGSGSGGLPPTSRRAEKAPCRDPPSFGLFGASQDRTQDLFFPPTIGSRDRTRLPEPTSPLPYLVQLNAMIPGKFENVYHRFHDVDSALAKANSRLDCLYHQQEMLQETLLNAVNASLRSTEHMRAEFNNLTKAFNHREPPARATISPALPLPRKPTVPPNPTRPSAPRTATDTLIVPEVVITTPAGSSHPPTLGTTPSATPAPPTSSSTRTRLPRKSAEGPKNYVEKPLTPSPHSSPDPLNPPTIAGPSRSAPSYASAAASGGAFQPVISRRNRNHRNRTPRPASSPPMRKQDNSSPSAATTRSL